MTTKTKTLDTLTPADHIALRARETGLLDKKPRSGPLTKTGAAFLARVGNYGNAHAPEWMVINVADFELIKRHGLEPYLDVRAENAKRKPVKWGPRVYAMAVRWTPEWRAFMEGVRGAQEAAL